MPATATPPSFRDSITTVSKSGKRNWIYALQPSGRFYRYRTAATMLYLAIFFTLPFIHIQGEPLFLFNILERRFIFFGAIFGPQDFFLLMLGMLSFIVFIIVFTVAFGRLFCGWACPQTIFMEMIFRRIEYWIEGNPNQQRRLNSAPWSTEKIIKKGLKHSIFFAIAVLISNTFLAYIIGIKDLYRIITEPITQHWPGLIALLVFATAFYAVFAHAREQVCLVACPYGRLQGVLLDKHSLNVAYDYKRGEPRSKPHKQKANTPAPTDSVGHCIDCAACVKVCPTGIDIRNGTQLECINCTACIDACDHIMDSIRQPRGLIRYASEHEIAQNQPWRFTPRLRAYTAVLTLLVSILTFLVVTRPAVKVVVNRAKGQLYINLPHDSIANMYTVKIINRTRRSMPLDFRVNGTDIKGSNIQMIGKAPELLPQATAEATFLIRAPKTALHQRKTNLTVDVYGGNRRLQSSGTTFFAPIYR